MHTAIRRRNALGVGLSLTFVGLSWSENEKPSEASPKSSDDPEKIMQAAEKKFLDAKEAAQNEYRQSLAAALLLANKAEALLLDFEPSEFPDGFIPDDSKEWFFILPYRSITKILKHMELSREQIKEAAKLVSGTVAKGDPSGGAFCHFPIHGLRFYQDGKLIYYTSFCWVCSNFYVQYPDEVETAQWVGFPDKDLEKWMNHLLPIPDAELKRFKEKYPKALK